MQTLPPRWEITKLHNLNDGSYTVTLGHTNPLPSEKMEFYRALSENPYIGAAEVAALASQMQEAEAISGIDLTPAGGEHDYYANLGISGYPDTEAARKFFEDHMRKSGSDFEGMTTSLSPVGLSFDQILEAFVPEDLAKEGKKALGEYQKGLAGSGSEVEHEKGELLGEEALFIVGQNGERVCQAVLINNFVVMGDMLAFQKLPVGNEPVHSVVCQSARKSHAKDEPSVTVWSGGKKIKSVNPTCQCLHCKTHPECSTLKAEGLIHREEVGSLLNALFARIKGEPAEQKEGVALEITRDGVKVKSDLERLQIKAGDTLKTSNKTQASLADGAGNKISLGGRTELKVGGPSDFELIIGTFTAFISKLKPKTKFDLKIPHIGVNSIRGTIFSVWTDKNSMTLTVVEGMVEFSDLKGNKVMVKENQSCICSKDQGLQNPVTLPLNLKEQYRKE